MKQSDERLVLVFENENEILNYQKRNCEACFKKNKCESLIYIDEGQMPFSHLELIGYEIKNDFCYPKDICRMRLNKMFHEHPIERSYLE